MIIFRVLFNVILFVFVTILCLYTIVNIKYVKMRTIAIINNLNITNIINKKISSLKGFLGINIDSIVIVFSSIILSIIVFVLSMIFIKIFSTSIILSLISFLIPYVLVNLIFNINIQKIKMILPSYIVNLKSNIEINNDIIKAISITKVEIPLMYSIERFNEKVKRGINVYKCFDELKNEINIEIFSNLIDAFKVCYTNGGEYSYVLNKYIDIVSKQNMEKAKIKEDSSATIITLIIMVIINIFLLFSVVLGNGEYRQIILGTTIGHVIINFGIISYVVIMYFVYKIYKLEE